MRFAIGVEPTWSRMTNRTRVFSCGRLRLVSRERKVDDSLWLAALSPSTEQPQIHLEDGLEQTHVGALVQADLMFPEDVNHQRPPAATVLLTIG